LHDGSTSISGGGGALIVTEHSQREAQQKREQLVAGRRIGSPVAPPEKASRCVQKSEREARLSSFPNGRTDAPERYSPVRKGLRGHCVVEGSKVWIWTALLPPAARNSTSASNS
jgi:hypothetical protein